jgi:hypothetical protein
MSGGTSDQAQRDARYEELHSAYLEAVAEL